MLKLIRKAIKSDVKGINTLGNKLHDNFEKTFHIETEIDSNIAIVLVAEENGNIIGYLYALDFEDNADLLSIYVDENYRLNHIGYKLLNELQKNCKDETITLEVSSKNIGALALYKKSRFKEVGIRKRYYKDADAIIMKWGI